MGLRRAGRAVVAASPAAIVSQGKRRRHRQPQPGQPRGRAQEGGGAGMETAQPGQHPRERAAARGSFHELLREILPSKRGLGVPRGEAGSMKRRHPAAGPAGLEELAKTPVTPTSILWRTTGWSVRMFGCGRLNCVHLLAALGWARTVLRAVVLH